jgi:hypothetical protein
MIYIISDLLFLSMLAIMWGVAFFVFDDMILKGYFKRKLQNRFKVEE